MPLFEYRAQSPTSGEVSGTLTADTPRHARDELRDQGLRIASLKSIEKAGSGFTLEFLRKRRFRNKTIDFVRELTTLLRVGVPLLSALDTILLSQKGRFARILKRTRERIASGKSLAEALREEKGTFDSLTLHMVEVGEASGRLEEVLTRLSDYQSQAEKIRGRVVGALIYPSIVLVLAIVVTLLLMTLVVPNILEPLIESGRELPWVTRIVRSLSDTLLAYWWAFLLAALALSGAFTLLIRSSRGRRLFDWALLRVPVLGSLIVKQSVVRIALITSTLLRSGVVVLDAFRLAAHSTDNSVLRRALESVEDAVSQGRDIASSVEDTEAFPPTVVQVLALGQQSGELESLLETLAESYDHQATALAQRFSAMLEPAMILLLAILVGFIAFATILPILEAGHVL